MAFRCRYSSTRATCAPRKTPSAGNTRPPEPFSPGHSARSIGDAMLTPDELARTYAAAWLERDPAARKALLESCCQPNVRFLQGSDDEVVGIDDLSDGIWAFQASWPTDGDV